MPIARPEEYRGAARRFNALMSQKHGNALKLRAEEIASSIEAINLSLIAMSSVIVVVVVVVVTISVAKEAICYYCIEQVLRKHVVC